MAESTKAELLEENEGLKQEIELLNTQISSSPFANDANYQREIERLTKKSDKAESELKAIKQKSEIEKQERETIAADRKKAEEQRLAEFGIAVDQDHHTRFRKYNRVPSGQRDIFGDSSSSVFNLGVELSRYSGGLYVPVDVVIEMGRSIGMLTKDEADAIKSELTKTNAKVEAAGALAQELIHGITSRVDHFYSSLDSVVPLVGNGISESESNDEDAGQANGSDKGVESTGIPADSKDSDGTDSDGTLFGKRK